MQITCHIYNDGNEFKWNPAIHATPEQQNEEFKIVDSIVQLRNSFYDTLAVGQYIPYDFNATPIDNWRFISQCIRDGKPFASPGQASGRDLDDAGNRQKSELIYNHLAWKKLYDDSPMDAYLLVFHELIHVEETSDYLVGVTGSGDRRGASVFNEALTNLKARRLVELFFGKEMPRGEQLDMGLKNTAGTFNYSLPTHLADNMLTAMNQNIDDLIDDGINNKSNHKQTISDIFYCHGADFEKDVGNAMEHLYEIIYASRVRNLTAEEQKVVCDVVKKMQKITSNLYIKANPRATVAELADFSRRYINHNDTRKQANFPLAELCGVEPEQQIKTKPAQSISEPFGLKFKLGQMITPMSITGERYEREVTPE
jgi:hypothetical protein